MTCIVGLVHNGNVYIGADSAGSDNYSKTQRSDKKVFKNGQFVIGFTTSFRMGQLLQYSTKMPDNVTGSDLMRFMVVEFVPAIRESFKSGGFASISNNTESGGTFLVGFKDRLFCIYDDFQVAESLDRFDSCGSGSHFALGSLMTTKNWRDPVKRLTKALQCAATFSTTVCAPFNIIST